MSAIWYLNVFMFANDLLVILNSLESMRMAFLNSPFGPTFGSWQWEVLGVQRKVLSGMCSRPKGRENPQCRYPHHHQALRANMAFDEGRFFLCTHDRYTSSDAAQ